MSQEGELPMIRMSLAALAAAAALGQPALAKDSTNTAAPTTAPQTGSKSTDSTMKSDSATKSDSSNTMKHDATGSNDSTYMSNQLVGNIQKIDKSNKSITIDQAGQPQDMKYTDSATVFMNGRLGGFTDLQEGQQVRAAFDEKNGTKTLRWIEVTPKGSAMQPSGKPSHDSGTNDMKGSDQGAMPEKGSPGDVDEHAMKGDSAKDDSMKGAAMTDEAKKNAITGKVVKTGADKLTLEQNGFRWTIDLKKNAPIFIDDEQSSLKVLREGQQVRAAMEDKNGAPSLHVYTKM